MELKGKILALLETKSGQGKNGEWKSKQVLIEQQNGEYRDMALFEVFGDKVDLVERNLKEGMQITAHINIKAREYQGKWYSSIQAWKIDFEEDKPKF